MWGRKHGMCGGQLVEVGALLPSYESLGLNTGWQAWQEALVPTNVALAPSVFQS